MREQSEVDNIDMTILRELDRIDRENSIFKGVIDMGQEAKRFTYFENLGSLILGMERKGLIRLMKRGNPFGALKITEKRKAILIKESGL